jgi:hypothetical protein
MQPHFSESVPTDPAGFGRYAARAGHGLGAAVRELAGRVAGGPPPLGDVVTLAEAWADEMICPMLAGHCQEPLTGLASLAYLRVRLGEVYREAARQGRSATSGYALVVITETDGDGPAGLDGMLRRLVVAAAVRRAFPGGDTTAALSAGRLAVLARRRASLPRAVAGLPAAIAAVAGPPVVLATLSGLPPTIGLGHRLLDQITVG